MTCRTAIGIPHHDLDFTRPTPMGFARCRRCDNYFTIEQWAAWPCDARPGQRMANVDLAPDPTAIPCALCGAPVPVDSRYRDHVESFGATCDRCFTGIISATQEADHHGTEDRTATVHAD